MSHPAPGVAYPARVADLSPPTAPTRVALYWRGTTLALDATAAAAAQLAGLQVHQWVTFRLAPDGTLAHIAPLDTHVPAAPRATGDATRWHGAPGGVSRHLLLHWRHRVLSAVRAWFDAQGFLALEVPALVRAPSPEPVFAPIPAGDAARDGGGWLITSPEFQLKRMLVGGFERIYSIGPAFRGGEAGAHHNPEFTLLEWYRVGADSTALAQDLEGLLGALAPLAAACAALWPDPAKADRLRGRAAALARPPFARHTVRALFAQRLGVDLTGVTTVAGLRRAAEAAGLGAAIEPEDDFTAAFSRLWLRIEAAIAADPALAGAPLLVTEWPAPTASLARLKPGDASVAERVELYAGGLELANGFAELTDPAEQRRRFEADLAARAAQGLPAVPLDEAFLAALAEGMPPAAGMALGIDRLVMLVTGAETLREVLPFAWDER